MSTKGLPRSKRDQAARAADIPVISVGNKVDDIAVKQGDQLHFITWGGGGWGDPLERDPELVGLEIRQGLVTAAGARAYGVGADDAGAVDAPATEALRAQMRGERGPTSLFDYGPGIATLREQCESETGLPAPIQPVWRGQRLAEAAE